MTLIHTVASLVMYPLYAQSVCRFLSLAVFVRLTVIWIVLEKKMGLVHGLIGAESLLVGLLLAPGMQRPALKPHLYAAFTALPVTVLFLTIIQGLDWSEELVVSLWPSSALLAMGLVALLIDFEGGWRQHGSTTSVSKEPWFVLAVAAGVLLSLFTTPGILVGLGLIGLGCERDDRIILGLAYAFLSTFLVLFYYALNIDLAYKSGILVASGPVLSRVRQLVSVIERGKAT